MIKMTAINLKKRRVSKKSKLSWRKHAKVQDVEEFLEQRVEEDVGPNLSTVLNNQYFVVDTGGDISSKERRKQRAARPLRCFSALVPHTSVPDPIVKRNRVKTPEERKSIFVKQKEERRRKYGVLTSKEMTSIAERRLYEIKKEKKEKRGEFTKDIWSVEQISPFVNDEWADTITKKHNLRGTGVPVKTTAKSVLSKSSILPPIEPPHPGMSYNPSYKDHQDLLKQIAQKELSLIKEEEHLNRVTKDMFKKVTEEKRDTSWIVEMSEGLPSAEGTNIEENLDNDDNKFNINPPVKNKKKTLKQRRKQKEQFMLEKAKRALKLEKRKAGDVNRIRVFQKQIETLEKKHVLAQKKRKLKAEKKKLEPKVLSSTKYESPDLEFNMGEDISGTLRNLKREGNLLTDRFKNMQKRNILEPSKRQHHKKAKIKTYVKPGHREDWKETVARTFQQ
ncbi:ribosome biogenesis protein NOP53 [Cylas formicarius]|uniref:ribosome biogenesis protein NOP53 n=1 Tax=Cylas formicarius TaxID=197179 RepID=UPI0029587B5A|nr:ribosome biogenesis protein NOP53 [Cylas formicarius]